MYCTANKQPIVACNRQYAAAAAARWNCTITLIGRYCWPPMFYCHDMHTVMHRSLWQAVAAPFYSLTYVAHLIAAQRQKTKTATQRQLSCISGIGRPSPIQAAPCFSACTVLRMWCISWMQHYIALLCAYSAAEIACLLLASWPCLSVCQTPALLEPGCVSLAE
jgi:hypothetical protein